MTKKKRNQAPQSKSLTVALAFVVAPLLIALIFMFHERTRGPIIPNICPIDGQLAQWSKRQSQRDCEYSHFSTLEKTTHTWLAACR
jgi:hypothetical protein